MAALTSSQLAFVDSVLALRPQVAVFDCDGTLWAGDAGEGFFYWEMDRGLVAPQVAAWARARYEEYRQGRVSEEQMCGEMVTMHRGLQEDTIAAAAREYFEREIASRVFPEMLQLTARLAAAGCELWAVSSTNNWVVEAAVERFNIPRQNVLAACVKVHGGVITDELIQVPSGEAKAVALRQRVSRPLDATFGNSIHDAAMLALARHAFAINPSDELQAIARRDGWTIYRPQARGR